MKQNLGTSIATVLTVAALIGFAAIAPGSFQALLEVIKVSVIGNLGFIFTYPAFIVSVVFVVLMFTPLGGLRFGEEPRNSRR